MRPQKKEKSGQYGYKNGYFFAYTHFSFFLGKYIDLCTASFAVTSNFSHINRMYQATEGVKMLKAIETKYNGYRFRSRLEARWAVFLDYMGVNYEYEAEGYDLESGYYLPDFWLPNSKFWLEIKPVGGDSPHCQNLHIAGAWPVVIGGGLPGCELSVWVSDFSNSGCGVGVWFDCDWALNSQGLLSVNTHVESGNIHFCTSYYDSVDTILTDKESLESANLSSAIIAARSARFEHGEQPIFAYKSHQQR